MSAILDSISPFMLLFASTVCTLLLILLVVVLRSQRRMHKYFHQQHDVSEQLRAELNTLRTELTEHSERYQQLCQQLAINERYEGHQSELYLEAINAAKTGATMEHLVKRYQVSQSEAELIVSMHGSNLAAHAG